MSKKTKHSQKNNISLAKLASDLAYLAIAVRFATLIMQNNRHEFKEGRYYVKKNSKRS